MPTEAAVQAPLPRVVLAVTPERALAALLAVELVWFSLAGTNFLTFDNGLEILRATTEIGLLALLQQASFFFGNRENFIRLQDHLVTMR